MLLTKQQFLIVNISMVPQKVLMKNRFEYGLRISLKMRVLCCLYSKRTIEALSLMMYKLLRQQVDLSPLGSINLVVMHCSNKALLRCHMAVNP